MVALPSQLPLQETLVDPDTSTSAVGWLSVTLAVAVQPFASRISTVYVPAQRLLIFEVVCPPGDQVYEYVGVPPETTAAAVPLQTLLQVIGEELMVTLSGFGSVIVTCPVAVQPFASVTVTVKVPGHNPEIVGVVCPPGAQE
jgi:hypothetical protein